MAAIFGAIFSVVLLALIWASGLSIWACWYLVTHVRWNSVCQTLADATPPGKIVLLVATAVVTSALGGLLTILARTGLFLVGIGTTVATGLLFGH
jgi:hypothetical protein